MGYTWTMNSINVKLRMHYKTSVWFIIYNKIQLIKFKVVDLTSMVDVCKQSTIDAIVDYGGLDDVLTQKGKDDMLKTIDHLQNAVRLGNILICISKLDKELFCSPFEERFGWVQELDGDPGEISAWYRGKTNIQKSLEWCIKYDVPYYISNHSNIFNVGNIGTPPSRRLIIQERKEEH